MVDGNKLGDVGFKYVGTPYSVMDCQTFVEKCLSDCGLRKDLPGSNAWYREVLNNGAIMTPEECVQKLGKVPSGAFLFIWANDGGEEKRGYHDGLGNASHIGLCTGNRGEGAIASSKSRGCVAESKFKQKTIKGGWNRVGLWNKVAYDYGGAGSVDPDPSVWRPTVRRGSKGTEVAWVQSVLAELGYDLGPSGIDGDFGKRTEDAVIAFQKSHGLNPDGVVGPLTYEALENETPLVKDEYYTVTIHHVTKEEAEAFQQVYADVEVKGE